MPIIILLLLAILITLLHAWTGAAILVGLVGAGLLLVAPVFLGAYLIALRDIRRREQLAAAQTRP
jgi:hypothetical protein